MTGLVAGGGTGTPGGSTTQLQYNNAGAFGGLSTATTDGTNLTLTSANFTLSASPLVISGNINAAAWTTSGIRIKGVPGTLTDTTSSGTVATAYTDVLGGNTIAASSATTFTNYVSQYIKDPVAGTNVTLTNKWAVGGDSARFGTSNQATFSTTGVLTLATALAPTSGGTGLAAWTTGDIPYASATNVLSALADVATGSVLISGGVGVAPQWNSTVTLTTLTCSIMRTSSTGSTSNFATVGATGIGSAQSTASLLFGGASNVQFRVNFNGSGSTVLTAASSYAGTIFGAQAATEAVSGVHAILANVAILAPVFTDGTATTTDATTLLVTGPPTGTATITNAASAAWFQTGDVVHGSAAIATNATSGFTYIATCAGTPSGTPTTRTGLVPFVYDTTAHQFWIYDSGWKQPKTPAAAATVTWQ